MQSSFRFSNLLGATYQGGSVQFTPDGNTLLSPVGNRVNATDLVQGRCCTLAPENRKDISVLALSPDARLLLSVDKTGHALVINFTRGTVLCRMNFKGVVQSARWSPDSAWLAVTHERKVQLWRAPTLELGWQFVHHRGFAGHHDDIVDVTWAPNSLFLATCGKDMAVRIWSVNPMEGFEHMALVEHRSQVRGAFFSEDMKHLYSLSRDGVLVSLKYTETENDPDATDVEKAALEKKPLYCRPGTWALAAKAHCQQPTAQKVMRCAFDGPSRLLAAGFSGGIFMLYEMPELQALQTLSLGSQPLDAVALGAKGDWLAVGSAAVGQLLVWEWRSETYVLKQQGHHWGVQCTAFSPAGPTSLRREKSLTTADQSATDRGNALSGRLLATGGYDGKIKLFNAQTGLCFVTFAEHTAPVSGLCFTPQGNAILSASQDGSVRAFDLLRYRNFRTFASPDGLCQFGSVAVDGGGEIVAASSVGGKYCIYVWSIQTGNILDVLAGHTSMVQSIRFSTSPAHPGQLISASWDTTLKVWDLYANANKGGSAETLECSSSILSVAYDPRGNNYIAASCLSGQVLFWDVSTGQQMGSIEGLRDIQSGRQWKDRFSATHMKGLKNGQGLGKTKDKSAGVNLNQHFSSIAYVKSGELLLCGSRNSPHLCLYDTSSFSLAVRYTLTSNQSLSGTKVILNSKNMTEQGASWQEFDLTDSDADDAEVAERGKRIRQATALPGVSVGEGKDAYAERELHVWDVAFSADSQQMAAATTHGVFVYTADIGLGTASATSGFSGADSARFVPQMLTKNVSAPSVLEALEAKDLPKALILALALNDCSLIRRVYESVPARQVPVLVASIGAPLLPALLWFLSSELRPSTGSPHFEFHVSWIQAVIDLHFLTLMELSTGKHSARTGTAIESSNASRSDVASLCLQLLVELTQRHAAMAKTFDGNTYLLRYLKGAPGTAATGDSGAEEEDDHLGEVLESLAKKVPEVNAKDSVDFFSGKPTMMEGLAELAALVQGDDEGDEAEVAEAPTKKRKKKVRRASS